MIEYELDTILDDSNFRQENLILGRSKVLVNDHKAKKGYKTLTLESYILPGYESFSLREYTSQCWVLSIAGKMLTYGSYNHVIAVIKLVIKTLTTCWNSESSILFFLSMPDYKQVLRQIVIMRESDHNMALNK